MSHKINVSFVPFGGEFDPCRVHSVDGFGVYRFVTALDVTDPERRRTSGPELVDTRGFERYVFYQFFDDGVVRGGRLLRSSAEICADGNILIDGRLLQPAEIS